MTDYKEEQDNELEALESIYPDELKVIQTSPYAVFELGITSQNLNDNEEEEEEEAASVNLKFTYTEKYPDEVPLIEISESDNLEDEQLNEVMDLLHTQEEDYSSKSTSPERPVRGRGRGRSRGARGSRRAGGGRGRGHPSSRSRGRSRSRSEPGRADEALRHIQGRQDSMKDQINQMSVEECRKILLHVLEKTPTIMIDIMRPAVRQPGGYHPGPDVAVPEWCVCTKCREMPTANERVCCGKENCVSLVPDFQVLILDEAVLALARLLRKDILVYDEELDHMAANRHTAYRQYVLWTFGHLGAGDRRVIPSCCVWKIRDKFPDTFGQYTGYKPSRLG